jgi:sensor domain CHASE-containing protein
MSTAVPISSVSPVRRARILTAAVFALSALVTTAMIWRSENHRLEHERIRTEELALQYTHAAQLSIEQALSSAYAVGTLVKLGNGKVQDFDTTAATLLTFYPGASALELAPGGVVRQVIPLAGNERAVGHNLLADPQRDKEAFRARDTGRLTLAGPFKLVQGGMGAAGRLPVYLDDGAGASSFWGFVIVLIRFPDILNTAHLPQLVERGYRYELWRIHPDSRQKHVIAASSDANLIDPVQIPLQVPNATWTLSVSPARGWNDPAGLVVKAGFGILACIGVTGFARTWALRFFGADNFSARASNAK